MVGIGGKGEGEERGKGGNRTSLATAVNLEKNGEQPC